MKKILTIILLSVLLGVNVHAQGKYNVFAQDQPLSYVLKLISSQSDYKFVYNDQLVDLSSKMTVNVSSDRINDVMDAVCKACGITYTVVGKQIAISVPARNADDRTAVRKTRTVHGTVTDQTGDPLAGADIFISGTKTGTFSNVDGTYSLDVPDDKSVELTFGFIGMKPYQQAIGGKSVINVILYDDASQLDQIVVTGYQTISRERSAGSFAAVTGAAVKDQANIHGNILRSLEGSASGLSVNETADGVQYLIRGVSSINSKTEPLFIVDGVSMTKDQMDKMVNPNDVENVSVLKDATAASIWGAQAANGVIVITTKTGNSGAGLKVTYNGSFTYKGKPKWSYMDMMSSEEFIQSAVEVFDPQTYKWSDVQNNTYGTSNPFKVIYPHELPMYQYYLGEISLEERDAALGALSSTDGRKEYEKYFMSNAYLMNHSVSFSGGGSKSSFYASIEAQQEHGSNMDNTDEYKLFFRDVIRPVDWLTLDISSSAFYSYEKSHFSAYDYTIDLPYMSYYDAAGNELSLSNYVMSDAYREQVEGITGIDLSYYPVSDYLASTTATKTQGINANAGLTVRFADWISYEGRFQYSLTNSTGEQFAPASTFGVRIERAEGTDSEGNQYLPSSGGHFTSSNSSVRSYTVRNQINIDKAFGKSGDHRLSGVAGFEFSSRTTGSNNTFLRGYEMQTMQHIYYDDYYLNTTGVKDPALPSFASSSTNTFDPNDYTQSEIEYRFVSMYANGAYTFKDKYSLNASIRVDQSNLFGSDPSVQFKPIWSTGAIWNVRKEDFMQSAAGWMDRFNVRASFGYAGNSPDPGKGGPYNILSSVSEANYSRFGLGYVVATPANDKLSWEKTRTINFGLDLAFLGNRIDGSIDVYDKKTTNLLGDAPVDPTTGFTTVLSNIGTMTNKGVEFTVESTNITSGLFEWTTDFNFTYNRNKLVDMYVEKPGSAYEMVSYDYWQGYPYGTVFAYRWAGLDPEDGMPRVYDSQGNIVRSVTDIDSEDAVEYAGTTVPPFYGSLGNTFRLGNFDLSIQFIYNMGHVLRNDINSTYSYRLSGNLHKDFANRWKQPGDEVTTNIPAYYSLKNTSINETDVTMLYRYADINVLSASYIKLREVSLGYRFPADVCRVLHIGSAQARFQVSNLATIAFNGEGIDPESFYFSGSRSDKYNPFLSGSLNIEF